MGARELPGGGSSSPAHVPVHTHVHTHTLSLPFAPLFPWTGKRWTHTGEETALGVLPRGHVSLFSHNVPCPSCFAYQNLCPALTLCSPPHLGALVGILVYSIHFLLPGIQFCLELLELLVQNLCALPVLTQLHWRHNSLLWVRKVGWVTSKQFLQFECPKPLPTLPGELRRRGWWSLGETLQERAGSRSAFPERAPWSGGHGSSG